ncbi:hypothetical protein [Sorangium sp. So ce341]|uniref:hypothetical protein n=1 Tax=Sorangium sp. So ce341 TaxID=3133302 RepID=UPI003F628456
MHEHWPESLAGLRIALDPSTEPVDEAHIVASRRKHFNLAVQMADGTVYVPPGGGVSASNIPMYAVVDADRHAAWVVHQEALLRAELPRFLDEIKAKRGRIPSRLKLKLVLDTEFAWAEDDEARLRVRLQRLPG